ncbi:MAG: GGDEF domain-containing response regulator [Candidatus Omnitrophota bacterium]
MQEVNILVVEDSPDSVPILEKTLKEVGYRVWLVNDHKKALETLRGNEFAAVITEMRGKMNGTQMTEAVHKISPYTNVIIITYYTFINSAIEAMEAGAYAYITKPFHTSEIRIVTQFAVERYFMTSSDREKEHYAQLAVKDGLTGLYNRRYFSESIGQEFARLKRFMSNMTVLMIDIDNFKNYNDTQGHPAGDELLRKLAKLLKSSMREMDVICRYGGEEFIVMLPQTDKKNAHVAAERLCKQASIYLPTTLSIGIATYPDDAEDVSSLIEKADAALYKAKNSGKNKCCLA